MKAPPTCQYFAPRGRTDGQRKFFCPLLAPIPSFFSRKMRNCVPIEASDAAAAFFFEDGVIACRFSLASSEEFFSDQRVCV